MDVIIAAHSASAHCLFLTQNLYVGAIERGVRTKKGSWVPYKRSGYNFGPFGRHPKEGSELFFPVELKLAIQKAVVFQNFELGIGT